MRGFVHLTSEMSNDLAEELEIVVFIWENNLINDF